MKAVILSAGLNGKLSACLLDKPKAMLEISDSNLLSIQIDSLYKAGIDEIVVVRGFGKEYINIPGITYYDNDDFAITGTLYSLFCAEEALNDDTIIIYGDIVFDEQVINKFKNVKCDFGVGAIIDYKTVLGGAIDYSQKEMILFDNNNTILDIGKNICLGNDNSAFFAGILKLSAKGIKVFKNNFHRIEALDGAGRKYLNKNSLKKVFLSEFLNELSLIGVTMDCVVLKNGWHEIDTEEDYRKLCQDQDLMNSILKVNSDWAERSKSYNNLQWVNKSSTLDTMVDCLDCNTKRILDLGTGTGKVLSGIARKYPQVEGYGIDISPDMMGKIESKGFKLVVGKVEDLSMFPDEYFDAVTARMVLHHSSDVGVVFNEVMRVLKSGGKFIICEGTPPNKECLKFYKDMFKYKETRNTFLIDDLMNYYIQTGFSNILGKTVIMKNMSLNNWLNNAGVPYRNKELIRKMHYEADAIVKSAYEMKCVDDDLLMTWKFVVIEGSKD